MLGIPGGRHPHRWTYGNIGTVLCADWAPPGPPGHDPHALDQSQASTGRGRVGRLCSGSRVAHAGRHHGSSGTSRSPSLWRPRPLASSRARASGSMSRMLLVFLTLGRRKEGCVQRPEPAGDVLPLARFSEQARGPTDATREMQEAGAMAPPPLCPPDPGRPSLGGGAVQGGQQLIVKPWTRKGPQTLLSLQRSPHPSGTPHPWGGSFRRPPTDSRQDSPPSCAPTGIPLAAGNKSGKNHLQVEV